MKTIPVIAGLLIILGSIVVGVGTVQYQTNRRAEAFENFEPKQVKITNVSDSGFSVSWTTNQATAGYVIYGESEDNLQMKTIDDRDREQNSSQSYFIHYVTLLGLKPNTLYYFKIGSGEQTFDLSGSAYKTITGATIAEQLPADAAYGQVVTENNDPADGAIVYLQVPNAGLLSTLTKASGAWAIPISAARNEKLDKYVSIDKQKQTISLWIDSGSLGNSSANVPATMTSPVPTMVLGKIYDFTAAKTNANETPDSKFEGTKVLPPTNITLLSPIDEESLSTSKPVIIGKAPPGTVVSIEVNSETAIKSEVTADVLGNFTFQVPQNLPEGEHTVTITAMVNGVLKTIKKSFVVSAQSSSSPYYSATPSATLQPSLKPTKVPTPTITPKPTLIALAPTVTATPQPTVKVTMAPTIKPSATPLPTATPRLAATIRPTATIKPTATPKPTVTPRPTATPTPILIPTPTVTKEILKSGTPNITLVITLVGASLMMVGYTLGNDKKKTSHRV